MAFDKITPVSRREALRLAASKGSGVLTMAGHPAAGVRAPRPVFVSYAHDDSVIVEALVAQLRARGVFVVWDRDFPSDSLSRLTKAAIKEAACVIAVWSRASCISSWVEGEASRARKDGKLISTHVEGFDLDDLSLQFSGLISVPVTDMSRICDSLAHHGFTIKPASA